MTLTLGFEVSSYTYKLEVNKDIVQFNLSFSSVDIFMHKPSLGFGFICICKQVQHHLLSSMSSIFAPFLSLHFVDTFVSTFAA